MKIYEWSVIGAGPAGIAAVGALIDHGVAASNILWIDPAFKVGDFGALWKNVPSNTKVDLFLKFLYASPAFQYDQCSIDFPLNHLPRDKTCRLHEMVGPLQWVSEVLSQKVTASTDFAEHLAYEKQSWHIRLRRGHFEYAKNVILATGSEPTQLGLTGPDIIPLQYALDTDILHQHYQKTDTIAVFGGSHSAVLVIRNLIEDGAHHVINFYLSPLRYAVYLDDWILFDDTGLKGTTADWAKEHLHSHCDGKLTRVYASDVNVQQYLPTCQKVVYATGFKRRTLPTVEAWGEYSYIEEAGIIAPGLFGIGIAFPEAKYNRFNIKEHRVGLWKFMEHLQRAVPIWLKYGG